MSTFRLATINVYSFSNAYFSDNISDLVSILKPLNLDLIATQEIQDDDRWKTFCQHLSLPYYSIGGCDKIFCGVGIASRYPITTHSNQLTSLNCDGGKRTLLQCCFDGDHQFLKDRIFGVTHLDHLNEDDRLNQIKEFDPLKKNIDILMGDMNSLTREDYSDDYYQRKVVDVRSRSRWESPRFDLTRLIKDEWKYVDAFRLMNPTLKDEQAATCHYDTRIDYIFMRPKENDSWVLTKCSIIDTKGATDHHCVLAEFQRR